MANEPRLDEERISLARDLLREAVFQSRAKQAAGTSLARSDPNSKAGNCGLGAHAAIESRLSDKGRELAATSARFAGIQELINAIPAAEDQKAILDLQARISAEQGMLANDQTKINVLFQSAQAEEWARKQRIREQAIAGIGSLRRLPRMGL